MFSKASLLLAVCFQALRTGNSANYVQEIPGGGWQIGEFVNVTIQSYEHLPHIYDNPFAAPNPPSNCKLEFQDEKGDNGDRLLISFRGDDDLFFINSKVNGIWQKQENFKNIAITQFIPVDVIADKTGFNVVYKGKQYFRKYEFPLGNIKRLKVDCPQEPRITVTANWSTDDKIFTVISKSSNEKLTCTCRSE